jgi:hypothetical protein
VCADSTGYAAKTLLEEVLTVA